MESELAIAALVILEVCFIGVTAKWGYEWLYGGVIINLLLANTLGMKTISLFGFDTSGGNIFYASALFAALLLVEMYGVTSARRGLFFGVTAFICFLLAAQLVIGMPGAEGAEAVDNAMRQLFDLFSRVSFASLIALLVSLNLAISLYAWMKSRQGDGQLWLRNLITVSVSQFVDSVLFFSIAFLGTVSASEVLQFMLTGFVLKILFGLASTPFFYSNHVVIKEKEIT